MILFLAPFVAVALGVSPTLLFGWLLAFVAAVGVGYVLAQLVWEYANAQH